MEAQENPPPSIKKPGKLRLTLGGLILLVALAALGINAFLTGGTKVVDLKVGTGPAVKVGDPVTVHYVGTLRDGTVFDSSKTRGTPNDFPIGRGQVIKGWDVGIVGMQVGGVRKLVIPPEEAYGKRKLGPIPANSTLIFEIELLGIK